jgi:hypothetical protein
MLANEFAPSPCSSLLDVVLQSALSFLLVSKQTLGKESNVTLRYDSLLRYRCYGLKHQGFL